MSRTYQPAACRTIGLTILVLVMLGSACSSTTRIVGDGATPIDTSSAAPVPARTPALDNGKLVARDCLEWGSGELEDSECWTLQVLQAPDNQFHLQLPVTLMGHTLAEISPNPMLLISTEYVYDTSAADELPAGRQLVILAPRGGVADGLVACDEVVQSIPNPIGACLRRLDAARVSAQHFDASRTADDVMRLHELLGVESFSVILAQNSVTDPLGLVEALTALDPNAIDSVIVRPPTVLAPRQALGALRNAAELAVTQCLEDPDCEGRYPTVRSDVRKMLLSPSVEIESSAGRLWWSNDNEVRALTDAEFLVSLGRSVATRDLFSLLPAIAEEVTQGGGPLIDALPFWWYHNSTLPELVRFCSTARESSLVISEVDDMDLPFSAEVERDVVEIEGEICESAPEWTNAAETRSDSTIPVLLHATRAGASAVTPELQERLDSHGNWTVATQPGSQWKNEECARDVEQQFWSQSESAVPGVDCLDEPTQFWLGVVPSVDSPLSQVEVEFDEVVFSSQVPPNWQVLDSSWYSRAAHGLDATTLWFDMWEASSAEQAVEWYLDEYGWVEDSNVTERDPVVVNDVSWHVLELSFETVVTAVAFAEFGDSVVLVQLDTGDDELDKLFDEVLLPALDLRFDS